MKRTTAWLVATGLALVLAAALFRQTRDAGLPGWDSYPIILTSRVISLADAAGNFTEPLMDQLYESDFYRPLLNWSFALDHALAGTAPAVYQLSGILWYVLATLATFALAAQLTGSRGVALCALLFFALHPLLYEVVPVPPRRPELMCLAFMAAALTWQHHLGTRRGFWRPALLTLAAVASKETGVLTPALVALLAVLLPARTDGRRRLRQALVVTVPHALAVAAYFAARFAVLGKLGGHETTQLSAAAGRLGTALGLVAQSLFAPQSVQQTSYLTWVLPALAAALTLALWITVVRDRDRSSAVTGARQAIVLGLAWIVLSALTYAAAGRFNVWYLTIPLAALALCLAAAAHVGVTLLRSSRGAIRGLALAQLLCLTLAAGWQLRFSPFLHAYDGYAVAARTEDDFLEQLAQRIEAAGDGTEVLAPSVPRWLNPAPHRPHVQGIAMIEDYSLQAWTQLRFPDRRVRIVGVTDPRSAPQPGEVVVVLRGYRRGFEKLPPNPLGTP